jgi:hypothetical protein
LVDVAHRSLGSVYELKYATRVGTDLYWRRILCVRVIASRCHSRIVTNYEWLTFAAILIPV